MRKAIGFVIVLGVIVAILQFLSWWTTHKEKKVLVGPPVRFEQKLKQELEKKKAQVKSALKKIHPKPQPSPPPPAQKKELAEKVAQRPTKPVSKPVPKPSPPPLQKVAQAPPKVEAKPAKPLEEKKPQKAVSPSQVPTPSPKPQPSASQEVPKAEANVKEGMELSASREIRTISVPDQVFRAVEVNQGKVDEITDAQKELIKKGAYGWGVLLDYKNPDQAIELLGGVLVAQRKGTQHFYTLRISGSTAYLQEVVNPGEVFGAMGLRAHSTESYEALAKALRNSDLQGEPSDYNLWYLFPKKEATYIANKVVNAFECAAFVMGYTSDETEQFRKEARLRFEVVALTRPNGGRLGCLIPKYFSYKGKKIPFPSKCLAEDLEWHRIKGYLSSKGG